MVLINQKGLFAGSVVIFGQKWLYSGKSGCNMAKVVVFGQKWLYSGKIGVIRVGWLYSSKVVVLEQK